MMERKTFQDFIREVLPHIKEVFPWDLKEEIDAGNDLILLDVRCPFEYNAMHLQGSMNITRGLLETACDYGYEHTVPELVEARDKRVVVICRSGNRSALAARVMQMMGYRDVVSLKTGLRGWSESEFPLVNDKGEVVPQEEADEYFIDKISPEQLGPAQKN